MPSVSSLPRPCLITSRDVNEARWLHTSCRPCAFEEKKSKKTKTTKNPPRPKHTTISTAARRPRPPRDGARRNTFHTGFHRSRVCGNRPRTALAIAYGKNGLGRFVPSVSSFTANGSEKREKEKKTSPPPAIVTATPTGHPTPSKLRGRVGKSLRPARS